MLIVDHFMLCGALYLWLPRSASVIPFTEEEYSDGDIPVAVLNCLEKYGSEL